MAVVTPLPAPAHERRAAFTALKRDEAQGLEDVENLGRRLLRALREEWQPWLVEGVRDELWAAYGRLDTTRARLAVLQEG